MSIYAVQYGTSPINRYVRGPTMVEGYPAASGVQLNVGDLTLYFSGLVWPAAQAFGLSGTAPFFWNSGAEIQNWSGARANFLGVSLGTNNAFSVVSGSVPIALEGTFQFPFPAVSGTTYQPGTSVGFTQDPCNGQVGSGFFASQALMQCSGAATGIGKVLELFPASSSGQGLLTVYLQSTVAKGTIQP